MSKPKSVEAPIADPASDRVVLTFTGSGGAVTGAPARDLTAADLARLAYREAARRSLADGARPDPRNPDQSLAAEIVGRLVGTHHYEVTAPAPAAGADATEG